MNNRTVTILLAVAVLLAAFIYFIEKKSTPTDEKNARRNHVFQTCRKSAIDRVELQVGDEPQLVLQRVSTVEQGGEKWEIAAPASYRADSTVMSEILSAIDFLTIERRIRDDANKPQYGFAAPRVRGAFHMGKTVTSFAIGSDDPSSDGVYVKVDGAEESFYAVHREFFESLNRKRDDVRDRFLVDTPLSGAVAVTLKDFSLRRASITDHWEVGQNGHWMAAATGQVNELLDGLTRLRAERFDVDPPAGEWQIATAKVTRSDESEVVLSIGGDCGDGRVVASVSSSKDVVCVKAEWRDLLARPFARYVDRTPLSIAENTISRITLEKDGRSLVLERTPEELWQLSGSTAKDTDQLRVAAFIELFTKTRAESVRMDADAPLSVGGAPAATVRFERDSGQAPWRMELFGPVVEGDASRLFLRRNGEPGVLVLAPAVLEGIRPGPLAFALRTMQNCDPSSMVGVVRSGVISEKLLRSGDNWEITAPVSMRADAAAADGLLALLCHTEVADFVEPDRVATAAFTTPWLTISGQQSGDKADDAPEVTLEIGAVTPDGGRYARFSSTPANAAAPVFILDESALDVPGRPAASPDELAVETDAVQRVVIIGNGRKRILRRDDGEWRVEGKGTVDSAQIKRMLIDLGAFRARKAHSFGNAVDKPALVVELYAAEGQQATTLHFGNAIIDESGERLSTMRVWKSSTNVTWEVPARWANELLELMKTGEP